jgi:hypothetical protein
MRQLMGALALGLLLAAMSAAAGSSTSPPGGRAVYALDSMIGLKLVNVKGEATTYRGRRAVRLIDEPGTPQSQAGGDAMAILTGTDFQDGAIQVDVAGAPRAGAGEGARGFIGIAFRVQEDAARFEYFYLRPTNGRAEDQLRRNHATQYASHPDFPWKRLRQDSPGVYESYVDLEPGSGRPSASWLPARRPSSSSTEPTSPA